METMPTLPPLQMGDICNVWWPHDDRPNQPGPKFRPVFVLGETVQDGIRCVVVAYGTTHCERVRETRNGGDIIVQAGRDIRGLLKADTRFDFNFLKVIPLTSAFFSASREPLKLTALPENTWNTVAQCMINAGVTRLIKRLSVRL